MTAEQSGIAQRCVGKKKRSINKATDISERDRKIIYQMKKAEKTQHENTQMLSVNHGSIIKELRRNRGKRGYRTRRSHRMTLKRKEGENPSTQEHQKGQRRTSLIFVRALAALVPMLHGLKWFENQRARF